MILTNIHKKSVTFLLFLLILFNFLYNGESQISSPLFPLPDATQIRGAPTYSSPANGLKSTTSAQRSLSVSEMLTKNYDTNIFLPGGGGAQLEIAKSIKPKYMGYLLPNKTYQIHVEIKNLGEDSADIQIIEKIEPTLYMMNLNQQNSPQKLDLFRNKNTRCIQLINGSNLNRYEEYASINNGSIYINLINLSFNQRFVYDYFIMSDKIGRYNLDTIIRRRYPKYAEVDLSKEVEFKNRVYNVNAKVEREYSDVGEVFKIIYNIVGDDVAPIDLAKIKYFKNDDYDIFEENGINNNLMREYLPYADKKLYNYNNENIIFPVGSNTVSKVIYVVYRHPGAYRVPTIIIDGLPYFSDLTISVGYRINRLAENIYSIVSVLGILLTLIYTIHEIKPLTIEIRKMNKLLDEVNHNRSRKIYYPYKRGRNHKKI